MSGVGISDTGVLSPMTQTTTQTGSRIAPAKARVGIILSSSNRVVEAQLRAFAPPELGIHVTRMRMSKNRTQSMPEQIDTIIRAAELVADAKVDVIVLQASSFAMEKGPEAETKVVEAITKATGVAALTSTQAMVQALKELALKRLILVSPSAKAMSDAESAYLRTLGFQVINAIGLDVGSGAGLAMAPSAWLDVVKSVDRPEADGYFLSGSNTTIVEAIGLIERAGGKPAVTSTQATLWASAKRLMPKLGKVAFSPELGRLFAHL